MAPAIAHFLVGAALLLLAFAPIALRYDVSREHAIWLIPLGGIWGLLPDVHHIAPIFQAELYALHNTAWMDLFALHYTLDRPAVRARYYESVFGSIVFFTVAVAAFSVTPYLRASGQRARQSRLARSVVAVGSSLVAAAYATVVLGVIVSIQHAFGAVSALVGSDSGLVGGLLLIPIGAGLGLVYGALLEARLRSGQRLEPTMAAVGGAGVGVLCWLGGVVILLPLWLELVGAGSSGPPLLHGGSLLALVAYGTVFGAVYALVREGVRPQSDGPIGSRSSRSSVSRRLLE